MIYEYRCDGCNLRIEVSRPMADRHRGPEGDEIWHEHDDCAGVFHRILSPAKRIVIPENEDQYRNGPVV